MQAIAENGLSDVIRSLQQPLLGICLGMQVLFELGVERGVDTEGMGEWPGVVRELDAPVLPHMGWNNVHQAAAHPLWVGIEEGARFYFVHSYFVQPTSPDVIAGFSHYPFPFTCAVAMGNIFAVQFHPEKSQNDGLTLLGNFVTWNPGAFDSACDMSGAACA